MADVFISYAREDKAAADQVARALQASGLEVFWDSEIPPGQTWADYIESKLTMSKVALVLWSAASTKSQWVREEARMGRDKGKLIPVMIDGTPAPFGFGEVQAAELYNWNGDIADPRWTRLQAAVDGAVTRGGGPSRGAAQSPPAPPPPPRPLAPPPGAQQSQQFANAPPSGKAMSPVDYVRKCLRLYVDGKGRARRAEYWWFALFQVVVGLVCVVLDLSLFGTNPATGTPNFILTTLVSLALACPGVSVSARRFHDVGLNGWLVAIGYALAIIWVGTIFLLVVGLLPGQAGANKYGPDPKAS